MWLISFAFILLSVAAVFAFQVLLAKGSAIRRHKNEVNLLWGLVKLVLWEANEGLIFLKNKRISDLVYGLETGGGTRFIFPIFGEELRIRVPLTLKLTQFQDANVLTQESTCLFVKVAIWWKVSSLEKYYYLIDRQVHIVTDQLTHKEILDAIPADAKQAQQDAAEAWILTLAESCIRKLVSQSTTALIVSKNASSYLHIERGRQSPAAPARLQAPVGARSKAPTHMETREAATPETLADEIHQMLAPKAADYGLEVERVEIQEVRLPQHLQDALDRLFRSHLLPAQSEQEARARQIELEAVAGVLGVETVALTEVMKQFRGSTYVGGFPKFIEALFAKSTEKPPAVHTPVFGPAEEKALADSRGPDSRKILKARCPKCGSVAKRAGAGSDG
jgi:regulator of protease activity HflC (stomatin/prohibitin superfamily)